MTDAPRAVLIRHGHEPDDDRVRQHLSAGGWRPQVRHPFAGDALGEMDGDVGALVVFGGKYCAGDADAHPFLKDEFRWMETALARGLPLLGICQGAQMLAKLLGGWTDASPEGHCEFGYHEIRPTEDAGGFLPEPLQVVQAHFHGFETPPGAVKLATSDLFPDQAFVAEGNAYGLQFHAEETAAGFRRWLDAPWWPGPEDPARPGVKDRAAQLADLAAHDAAQDAWFRGFLQTLFPAREAAA
ncbi:MAG: gamma-glutamyl-gamma-aminobutyrate hydrolase family protein [Pseudomonadota bacterium]